MPNVSETAERYAEQLLENAVDAAGKLQRLTQGETDRIVESIFRAAFDSRVEFARMAVEETGIGNLEHKIIKNAWASLRVFRDIISQKTVGVISEDKLKGISEIASPIGPILALTPVTNPTCTIIFKALIAMKTRNPLIFSPHGAARKCSRHAVEVLREAARRAGAPEHAIQLIRKRGSVFLDAVMRHPAVKLILATGTPDVVRMARASAKPTLGSGPGNVPVYVDRSADMALAAHYIVRSKSFDNGCVCSSEQALIVTHAVDEVLRPLLIREGTYFCSEDEKRAVMKISYDILSRRMRPAVVGKSAVDIARMAGMSVPETTRMLIMECENIGVDYPCSQEILAPILSYFIVEDFEAAIRKVLAVEKQGGMGHTLSLFCNDDAVIRAFIAHTSAGRILVNSPSTQGAIGGLYNNIPPSLTLSCGVESGNLVIDNITTRHLLHIQRLARRRINHQWYSIPREVWFDPSVGADDIQKAYDWNY